LSKMIYGAGKTDSNYQSLKKRTQRKCLLRRI
jgi:hypothetical protein